MPEVNSKKIAVIGAGPSGIVSAKYSKENGLEPTIFEMSDSIAGLWSPKTQTAIWPGLTSNVSCYFMAFSDHPYPKDAPIFSGKQEVYNYLMSYMEKFDLLNHLRLNTKVVGLNQMSDKRWSLEYLQSDGERRTEIYDFVSIASGLHESPNLPEVKDKSSFKGPILHSSEFKLNMPELKDKKVLVVGHSFSGADVSQHLVGYAGSVINVFRRPYLNIRRFVRFKNPAANLKKNHFNLLPIDFFFFNREIEYMAKTPEEKKLMRQTYFPLLNHEQTDKEKSNPELFYDLDNYEEPRFTIADNYWSYMKQGKIIPKRGSLEKFTENGVYLDDGTFYDCDAVIFCTGYHLSISYLDEKSNKIVDYDPNDYKMPQLLYKLTVHPDLPNLGMICQNEGVFFTASELQAKYLSLLFTGKINQAPRDTMLKEIDELRKKRNLKLRLQYPYGEHIEIIDTMAKEMGVLPDFEKIKESDPKLYNQLWRMNTVSAHFILGTKNDAHARGIMNEIESITTKEYVFDDDDESYDPPISELARKFTEGSKIKVNLDIFKT